MTITTKKKIDIDDNEMQRIFRRIVISSSFAGIIIIYSPKVEYTFLTFFLSLVYVWLNSMVERFFPGTLILDGVPSPKYRLYTSILHDGFVAGGILFAILLLRFAGFGNDIPTWLTHGWEDCDFGSNDGDTSHNLVEGLDVLAMCVTIAFEIKDGIVDDFDLRLERVGIYIHHVATTFCCLYILNCEYGKGLMLVNGLQALLGSLLYCLWRLNNLGTITYCVTMTLSNILGLWLTIKYFELAKSKGDLAIFFPTLSVAIIIIRQYPVMEVILQEIFKSSTKRTPLFIEEEKKE